MNCNSCGIPLGIGSGNIWRANGIITGRYPPYIRGAFFDVDELNNLFDSISDRIGFNVSRIVTEGKQQDAKRYMSSLLLRMREREIATDVLALENAIATYARAWGLADVRVLPAKPGMAAEFEVKHPYSLPLFLGDAGGVVEAIEGQRTMAVWEGTGEEGVIHVKYAEEEPELERRIKAEIEVGIESTEGGGITYEYCPECEAPLDLARIFAWELEKASIVERSTGKRFVLTNTNGIVAVIRQLLAELGEDVSALILEIERDYARDLYSGAEGGFYLEREFDGFPLRGWGRPLLPGEANGKVTVVLRNPFNDHMIAGRIWGMLEVSEKKSYSLIWTPSHEGLLVLDFIPRQ